MCKKFVNTTFSKKVQDSRYIEQKRVIVVPAPKLPFYTKANTKTRYKYKLFSFLLIVNSNILCIKIRPCMMYVRN